MKTWHAAIGSLIFIPAVTGFLLLFAYPTYNCWPIAWVALVPFLLVLSTQNPGSGFVAAEICGAVFFAATFYWILEVGSVQWFHLGLIAVFLGTYFGLFGFFFGYLRKQLGLPAALIGAPFTWVGVEYLRANMGFMAHTWPLLGHSQVYSPLVVQIAALAGAYGLSFLIMLFNTTLTALILTVTSISNPVVPRSPKRLVLPLVGVNVLLVTLTVLYGWHTTQQPLAGNAIKVAVVQANIPQNRKWDPRYASQIVQVYENLTLDIAKERAALIVWPEAATPRAINLDRKLYRKVKELAKAVDTPILLGSTHHQKIHPKKTAKNKFWNSAFLLDGCPQTKSQRYDKVRLLPFAEYLPGQDIFPWQVLRIPSSGRFEPGKEFTVFQSNGYRFAAPICWESAFPDVIRRFVQNGAQFIVNITNEAWFGQTTAPYQFLAINAFRAVENRVPVIRSTNTGVSCFIDPFGRVTDRITNEKGRDIFIRGILSQNITPPNVRTIYTRYGDWLAWVCLGISAVFLVRAIISGHRLTT